MISMGVITLILGLVGLFYFRNSDSHLEEIARAKGWATTVTSSYDANRPDDRTVQYKYQVNGKDYTGHAFLSPDDFSAQPFGSQMTINYLPSNPSVNAYQPDAQAKQLGLGEKVTLLIAGIGVLTVTVGVVKGLQNGWTSRFT
jgi:hypothetical protein